MAHPPELDLDLIRVRAEQDDNGSPIDIPRPSSPSADEIIVRADEVDETAADRPQRPILRREGSAPPPPPRQPPPPAPPAQDDGQQPESLSISQLRSIATSLPKLEPKAYAYSYSETRTFPEEIEEWFQYTEEDQGLWKASKEAFEQELKGFDFGEHQGGEAKWLALSAAQKEKYVSHLLDMLTRPHADSRKHSLLSLVYVALGTWLELDDSDESISPEETPDYAPPNDKYRKSCVQLRSIREAAELLCSMRVVNALYDLLRKLCDQSISATLSSYHSSEQPENAGEDLHQLPAALTILYVLVEAGRQQLRREEGDSIRAAFLALEPGFLEYLCHLIARLRWDDSSSLPFTKILLLFWKLVLLEFGVSQNLDTSKNALRNEDDLDKTETETFLTASPLDYHAFRQEITSKYPAYNPPPPLVPLEINNNTMLPPLPNSMSTSTSQDDLQALGLSTAPSKSIFHQPVHIATPAPSPPPSPGGPGGKGAKKQNYQTNQNFPFLYPPLDSSSNEVGGKGNAELQDRLVGKQWEGSDVPASILEAAQLFHSRMRMSRPLRQLWDVREEFIKYERGWTDDTKTNEAQIEESLDLDEDRGSLIEEDVEPTREEMAQETTSDSAPVPQAKDEKQVQNRLDVVETFYRGTASNLQSIVIVLLKVLLSNITVLGAQSSAQNSDGGPEGTAIVNGPERLPIQNLNLSNYLSATNEQSPEKQLGSSPLEVLNSIRTREITSKAISGLILCLLKWFRLSHILKFEYFAQLLLDSNYIPLALKYFALQDVDKAVDSKHDRDDLGFFRYCYIDAGHQPTPPPDSPPQPNTPSSSEDEAQPPPVTRHRPSSPTESPPPSPGSPPSPPRRPEVDELGYPTTAIPSEPLTTYAPRFFLTHITILRILQKLTKNHAHRALLLVQYKSSTILRKNLKIPQPDLRLYTLKLFKSQVPYCGRKWRQANMRVITAIYVFCRMGLRDEWISGTGLVDEWVDSAMAVERAWRGLVAWWHGRNYREYMGLEGAGLEAENDFFTRELEKMGWGIGGLVEDEGMEEDEEGVLEGDPGDWEGQGQGGEGWNATVVHAGGRPWHGEQ